MPKRGGIGPHGNGPMTGRVNGDCIIPLNTTGQKPEFLKNREQALEKQLQYIKDRIRKMQKEESRKEAVR
jgi:hypothetical protein